VIFILFFLYLKSLTSLRGLKLKNSVFTKIKYGKSDSQVNPVFSIRYDFEN